MRRHHCLHSGSGFDLHAQLHSDGVCSAAVAFVKAVDDADDFVVFVAVV